MIASSAFAEYLNRLMDGPRGLRVGQIATYAGVSHSTVINWTRGAKPKSGTAPAAASPRWHIGLPSVLRR